MPPDLSDVNRQALFIMDLMFAAEQYAQAQAAAVAAAQYYANMTAAAAVSAGQQPPPAQAPPGSLASVTSAPQDFGPLVSQAPLAPPVPTGTTLVGAHAFAPAPPVLSGLQAQYLMQQPPLPPKEPSSSRYVNILILRNFFIYHFHSGLV